MAERDIIEYIAALSMEQKLSWLEVGIGDDAAVARLPSGERVVVTTDMLIEGTHFEPGTPPEQIGRKAIARSLSDVAAMAARPLCVVAAVSFAPGTPPEFCNGLSRALWESAAELSAPLVGGDVSSGTGVLAITVTALGLLPPGRDAVTRAGACPDDRVCVTGALGGSLRGRHLSFTPRIPEALDLAERFELHAMIDISDGLSTDLLHIARASGIGVVLQATSIPAHEDAAGPDAAPETVLGHVLNDGEDYELIFCLPEADAKAAADSGTLGTPVTIVGTILRERTCTIVLPDGTEAKLVAGGWEHLKE